MMDDIAAQLVASCVGKILEAVRRPSWCGELYCLGLLHHNEENIRQDFCDEKGDSHEKEQKYWLCQVFLLGTGWGSVSSLWGQNWLVQCQHCVYFATHGFTGLSDSFAPLPWCFDRQESNVRTCLLWIACNNCHKKLCVLRQREKWRLVFGFWESARGSGLGLQTAQREGERVLAHVLCFYAAIILHT